MKRFVAEQCWRDFKIRFKTHEFNEIQTNTGKFRRASLWCQSFFFVRCVFGAVCESATLHDSNGRKGCLVRTDTWPTKYCNFRVYTKRNIQIAANSLKINRFGMFLDFSANISTAETLGWRWRCKILFTLECSYLNNRTHLGVTDVNIQRKPRHFIDG